MTDISLRPHFPCFKHKSAFNAVVYFDSAATTQKPDCVLKAINNFYLYSNVNVHRASYTMAGHTTDLFEQARVYVQQFINAAEAAEVVWTKGATESINLVANCLANGYFEAGQRILVSGTEHHANLVPWQQAAAKCGLTLDVIPVDEKGCWDVEQGLALITPDTALVAIAQVSNALGSINPINLFIEKAHSVGALTLIDGAQAISHLSVDVQALNCDFYVFSGHKAYAPTGIGVLYGKRKVLESMPVFLTGGEMIQQVTYADATFQPIPFKYEAGTPNIEGVIGLHAALNFIQHNRQQIQATEQALYHYLLKQLVNIPLIKLWGDSQNSVSILSFSVHNIANQDLAVLLNEQGFALRTGHHCAMPLMHRLGIEGTLRVSLCCYNTLAEIDQFVLALNQAIHTLNSGVERDKIEEKQTLNLDSNIELDFFPLANRVHAAKGWDNVYRQIMLAGKSLPRLAEHEKHQQNEVAGCESQVWLSCANNGLQDVWFSVDSPSKIVRGLLALVIEPLQHQSAAQISQFDAKLYLQQIGLEKHLSESRGNGLMAVAKRIKAYAEQMIHTSGHNL